MPRVTEPAHQRAAGQLRKYLAKYQDIELLLQLGEYKRGTDPDADIAIEKIGPMRKLLQQSADELVRSEEHTSELQSLMRISYAVSCLKKKKTTTHERHN